MAHKKRIIKGRDYNENRRTDGLRRAKPIGYRFKGENEFVKPTEKEIQEFLDGERDDIYYENRPERSDRKSYSKRGNRFEMGGELSDNDYYNVVNHFVYFTFNYPQDFMDAFGNKEDYIRKHIESKFDSYYKKYGSYGVMTKFWVELDDGNREKLAKWIKENYKGQKLNYDGDTSGIINHYVYFTQNYPNNFMDAFGNKENHLRKHIENKFNSYYDKYGTYGVMNKFWVELDSDNQKLLADWIKENYTGTTLRYAKGGSVTTSKLNEFISTINEEGGGEFTLGGAYGFQELWAWNYKTKGNDRIEVGSKKDIYNALIKYRYAERYNPKYSDGKYTSDKMSKGGELSDVMSLVEIESKLGRPLHWWNDDVVYFDDVRYKKVFMRPEYKKID